MFRTLIARLSKPELLAAHAAGTITSDEWLLARVEQMKAERRPVTVKPGAFPEGHPLAY